MILTEKRLPQSGLYVLRITDDKGNYIACHTSPNRQYIDKMIARYNRIGKVTHKFA